MAAKHKKRNQSPEKLISSFKVFCKFVEKDPHGGIDVSRVFSPECFEHWKKTRRMSPAQPEESFRRALTAHCRGSDGRQPFEPAVEEEILKILRKKERWPCFVQHDVSIGIYGFKAMGFHEKKKRLEQLTSKRTGTPKPPKPTTNKRAERRSPRARRVRDFARELMDSSSEDSAPSPKSKPRARKRRSPTGSPSAKSTDPRVEGVDTQLVGAGVAKELKRHQSAVMLKTEEFVSTSEAERKELKKKRSCDRLQLKSESNPIVTKVEVDPMLMDEQSSNSAIFTREVAPNMTYSAGYDPTLNELLVKKCVKSADTVIESSGGECGASKAQQGPFGFSTSSISTSVIGERPKSWSGEHVPRESSADAPSQNSTGRRNNGAVKRATSLDSGLIEHEEFASTLLGENWHTEQHAHSVLGSESYSGSHENWQMDIDSGDSSAYLFRDPSHIQEDTDHTCKDSVFQEIVSGVSKIAAQELGPLGYPNTCLKTVGLRRMFQYAEDNCKVQWLNKSTVALINSIKSNDIRYKREFLIARDNQFSMNGLVGRAVIDLNTLTYVETDENAKQVLRGELRGKHDWTFRVSRIEAFLVLKLVFGALMVHGTLWTHSRVYTMDREAIVVKMKTTLLSDRRHAVIFFQNASDNMQHILRLGA